MGIEPSSGEMAIYSSNLYRFFKSWGNFDTNENFYANGTSNIKVNTTKYIGGYGIIYYRTSGYSSARSTYTHYIVIEYIKSSHSIKITQPEQFYYQTDIYINGAGAGTHSDVTTYGYFTSRLATTPILNLTYVV